MVDSLRLDRALSSRLRPCPKPRAAPAPGVPGHKQLAIYHAPLLRSRSKASLTRARGAWAPGARRKTRSPRCRTPRRGCRGVGHPGFTPVAQPLTARPRTGRWPIYVFCKLLRPRSITNW